MSEILVESINWWPSPDKAKSAARRARRCVQEPRRHAEQVFVWQNNAAVAAPIEGHQRHTEHRLVWQRRGAVAPVVLRSERKTSYKALATKRAKNPATPQYVETVTKLIDLLELPGRWNSYNAQPIKKENVIIAVDLLARLMVEGTPAPQVVPKVRGGVQLEWHTRGMNIEIEIDSPENLKFVAEDLHSPEESGDEDFDEPTLRNWVARLSER